jgi:hypothetical protein
VGSVEDGLNVGDDIVGVSVGWTVGVIDGDFEGSKVLIVKSPLKSF